MLTVFQRSLELPPPDRREILRYAGVRGEALEIEGLLDECLLELSRLSSGKVCWCRLSLDDLKDIKGMDKLLFSKGLTAHLSGCREIIVFAATVGIDIDRAIARYSARSATLALLASAIGTERVEALCDEFEAYIRSEGVALTSRFSPGYSDLPLELQRDIFTLLDCPKRIGLTLNKSMLMSPSKSVSAIIGIK